MHYPDHGNPDGFFLPKHLMHSATNVLTNFNFTIVWLNAKFKGYKIFRYIIDFLYKIGSIEYLNIELFCIKNAIFVVYQI